MSNAMQPKGDGEWPYSAPFTGLNTAFPSILLPPTAQDVQTSPSFSIVRGSIAAPWPFSLGLFGSNLASGEYLLFATPDGYIVTNQAVYQLQGSATPATAWQVVNVGNMPAGAFGAQSNNQIPFVEENGNIFFSSLLGILIFSPNYGVSIWSSVLGANYLTVSNQRMIAVGTYATPNTPSDYTTFISPWAIAWSDITTFSDTPVEISVTAGSVTSNIGTFAAANQYYAGQKVTFSGFSAGGAPLNGLIGTVLATGLSSTGFEASVTVGDIGSTGTGLSTTSAAGQFDPTSDQNAGVDVLTYYAQGLPAGIINLGHSFYVQMTQGIVEADPASNGIAPFTFYTYWSTRVPVGAMIGSVAQWGEISAFITPDNVNIWVPGAVQQIGTQIMPYLRSILRNAALQEVPGGTFPLLQNPVMNSSFYTIYNELHYGVCFNIFGVPPQQATPPYPNQATTPIWFGLLLDYNFATTAWTQQVMPPMTGNFYQIIGPTLTSSGFSPIPSQNLLLVGTGASPSAQQNILTIATDVFNQNAWAGAQCQGLLSQPQPCQVGFPQTPIAAGHRPTFRRVRIEYSWDEMSLATIGAPVNLTVTAQGTITQNTGAVNGNGVATSTIQSISRTIQLNPPGIVATSGAIQPCLTVTAYADMVLSFENMQISLSWTDPSAHQRLLIHRVTAQINDSKGSNQ